MKARLASLSILAGYLGLILYAIAVVGRFYGERPVLGMNATNLFLVGIGVTVWGIWARMVSRPD